jgi:hypothetical protein
VQTVLLRTHWTQPVRRAFVVVAILAMLVEYSNRSIPLSFGVDGKPAEVYQALKVAKPGVIIEFPLPKPENLPGWDPYFQAWSVWHWRPMLNGYSGFYSRRYQDAMRDLESFPDAASIDLLRQLEVRYIILHRGFYEVDEYTPLALKLATAPGLTRWGIYKDPVGVADIFEIEY